MSYRTNDIDLDHVGVPRDYSDIFGRPLAVGDRVVFAVSRGSSAELQVAEIVKFVGTKDKKLDRSERDPHAPAGSNHWLRFWTYRKSWTLRVRYLELDKETGRWDYPSRWDSNQGRYVKVVDPQDSKTNTIRKIENVARIEL